MPLAVKIFFLLFFYIILVVSWQNRVKKLTNLDIKKGIISKSESGKSVGDLSAIFFFVALRPNVGHRLLILEVSRSHTTMHLSW